MVLCAAGALAVSAPLAAQGDPPPPPPTDSAAARDTTVRVVPAPDTVVPPAARDTVVRDTIKAPTASPERPRGPLTRGARSIWDRDALFASGALTLAELVGMVPGASYLPASFIGGVSATSWYGEPGRLRVFFDGVEIDVLDPRLGGSADLSTIPLWPLEEVVLERSPAELRIHLRSWRVTRTTAETRTDILTGSENTNLYRGFYGKRFSRGGVLQLAGQQFSTTNLRTRGDGDGLSAYLRFGTVRGRLTLDAAATRVGRTRTATRRDVLTTPNNSAIPGFKGRDNLAYLRAAWGDPDSSAFWLQGIAATVQYIEDDSVAASAMVPNADSVVTQGQFVGAVGFNRGPLGLSLTARHRTQGGEANTTPTLRASFNQRWLSASAFAESNSRDDILRSEAAMRLQPMAWWFVSGAVADHRPKDLVIGGPARRNLRGTVGLSVRGRELTVGVVKSSAARGVGMMIFDTLYTPTTIASAQAIELSLEAPLLGPFSFGFRAIEWDRDAYYRPKNETHAELRLSTDLRRYIPRGTFHLTAALTHDWRASLPTPDGTGGRRLAEGAGVYGSLVDIRIGSAHIFWYNRNFTAKVYETVPGYLSPRLVQLYGVRWQFWN